MFSIILITFVIIQRLVELRVAKRNEKWILAEGGYEVGASHYPLMILLHSSFFVALIAEVTLFQQGLSSLWGFLLPLFLLVQVGRIWCLTSLGKFWNTKIMILPHANVVKKGPYQQIRHPNYLIVTIELFIFPLLLNAYFTAFIFSILNIWMLSVRIPTEEKALIEATNYQIMFDSKKVTNNH